MQLRFRRNSESFLFKLLSTYLNFKLFIMKKQERMGMLFLYTVILITALIVLASCGASKNCHCKCDAYSESILNPENKEFVDEIAFNESIPSAFITQAQFNARYK